MNLLASPGALYLHVTAYVGFGLRLTLLWPGEEAAAAEVVLSPPETDPQQAEYASREAPPLGISSALSRRSRCSWKNLIVILVTPKWLLRINKSSATYVRGKRATKRPTDGPYPPACFSANTAVPSF